MNQYERQLVHSKKFLEWGSAPIKRKVYGKGDSFLYVGEKYTNLMVDERHFTPAELGKAWGVSAETVRQLFRNEPDVLRVGSSAPTGPSISRKQRSYVLLRIPESVALRVHKRLSAVPK